jgi:type IV pilus assembly protein PilQ
MAINMKKIISFFATTLLLITIGGCADNMFASISEPFDPLDEANFISIGDPNNVTIGDPNNATIGDSNNATINAKEFMEKSKQVVQETLKIGPVISQSAQVEKSEKKRIFVSREEVVDYTSINRQMGIEDGIFNVTINLDAVDIRAAMQMMAEIVNKNILIGDEVSGLVSMQLIDVPWDKALDSLLKIKGLAMHVDHEANIIRIHKVQTLIAQEEFERDRIERMKQNLSVKRGVEPLETEIIRIHYADLQTVRSQVLEMMQDFSSSGPENSRIKITADDRQKNLIIKAPRKELDQIAGLVDKIDVRTKQVLIEAFIVEAGKDFDMRLGAELGYNRKPGDEELIYNEISGVLSGIGGSPTLINDTGQIVNAPILGAVGAIGILLNTSTHALKVALSALEEQMISKTVSNPKIYTLDTETASISQGKEQPYDSSSGDGSGGTDTSFKEALLKLDVTPTIVGDGNIIIDISLQKDTVGVGTTPPINKMSIKTRLLVEDKSIVVIGGIYEDSSKKTESKVPFFGDLPIIGKLFRSDVDDSAQDELLIFISLQII